MDQLKFIDFSLAVKRYMRAEYPEVTVAMEHGAQCTSPQTLDALQQIICGIVWTAFCENAAIPNCAAGVAMAVKDAMGVE